MKIVELSYLEESVPPKKYGGTELIIANVIKGMATKGHDVYLFGTGDSKTEATLVPFLPKTIRDSYPFEELPDWRLFYMYRYMSQVIKKINEIKPDIVHNHMSWNFLEFADFIDCPVITTLHGPLTNRAEITSLTDHKKCSFVSISMNQRKAIPELNWVKNIYNGIEIDKFEVGKKEGRDYFLFLGRISPEKGVAELCKMIKSTEHKLKIAAKLDPFDKAYYDTEIAPLVDGDQIEYVGEVDHEGKKELLKNSKGLLMWLNWEEPFGLVVIEAFASGTPVIVSARGSMPELLQNGKNGFLVNSLDEMKNALDRVHEIDTEYCRSYCEQRFSYQRMSDEYLSLFEDIAGYPKLGHFSNKFKITLA
jgi:glycosyltransferase involved in cell wall biosynthesis